MFWNIFFLFFFFCNIWNYYMFDVFLWLLRRLHPVFTRKCEPLVDTKIIEISLRRDHLIRNRNLK